MVSLLSNILIIVALLVEFKVLDEAFVQLQLKLSAREKGMWFR